MSILDLSKLPIKKWYPVGLGLGVEKHVLDRVQNVQKRKKDKCMVCMFDDWLENHAREACYPPMKLVAVLLDAGEMESAAMVCRQYSKFIFSLIYMYACEWIFLHHRNFRPLCSSKAPRPVLTST